MSAGAGDQRFSGYLDSVRSAAESTCTLRDSRRPVKCALGYVNLSQYRPSLAINEERVLAQSPHCELFAELMRTSVA